MYQETKYTVNVYADQWQTRFNRLEKLVATSLAEPSLVAGATSYLRAITELKTSAGNGSGTYVSSSDEYQFDVNCKDPPG